MGIWNICFVYIVHESDKICMQSFVKGIITFIHVYVWPRVIMSPNSTNFIVTYVHPLLMDPVIEG